MPGGSYSSSLCDSCRSRGTPPTMGSSMMSWRSHGGSTAICQSSSSYEWEQRHRRGEHIGFFYVQVLLTQMELLNRTA